MVANLTGPLRVPRRPSDKSREADSVDKRPVVIDDDRRESGSDIIGLRRSVAKHEVVSAGYWDCRNPTLSSESAKQFEKRATWSNPVWIVAMPDR